MNKMTIVLFVWLVGLALSIVTERGKEVVIYVDPVTLSFSSDRVGIPFEYQPSNDGRSLIIIEPANGARFKELRVDHGSLYVHSRTPGSLTVHHYEVNDYLSVRTIEQTLFEESSNSTRTILVPKRPTTTVVLISTIGVECSDDWTTELRPV